MYSLHHLFENCNRKSRISLDFFAFSSGFHGHCMGNLFGHWFDLVHLYKPPIIPCKLSVEDVFPGLRSSVLPVIPFCTGGIPTVLV